MKTYYFRKVSSVFGVASENQPVRDLFSLPVRMYIYFVSSDLIMKGFSGDA